MTEYETIIHFVDVTLNGVLCGLFVSMIVAFFTK